MPEMIKPVWIFILEFSFLMFLSILSWRLIEKPINNSKKKFENNPPSSKPAPKIKTANANTFSY